jgi:dTDP-4-amino-4,6-dideoxy-D-galactose acyltransferase
MLFYAAMNSIKRGKRKESIDYSLHQERAYYYSPLSFLRSRQEQLAEGFLDGLANAGKEGRVVSSGDRARLTIRYLDWDSGYFSCPTYKLEFSDWNKDVGAPANALAQTLARIRTELATRHTRYYLFAEVPSEDLVVLQGMGLAGLRLIETRLTYFRDDLQQFEWPRRYNVRKATEADIPELRRVAIEARNRYDRFHAEPFYPERVADEFLATFIENSVKGFADVVLVPAEDGNLPGAFFTGKLMPALGRLAGVVIGCMVLSAVGASRRGWHLRLMAEMSHWFQEQGVSVAYMTTQSANRAVIRNCEKLGFRYGRSSHIFATH